MIAVADASPICCLVLIGEADLLPKLFTEVVVPSAVLGELRAEGSPSVVRHWAMEHPEWIIVRDPVASSAAGLERVHAGEREAIRVAEEIKADLILLDDKTARRIAMERGLRVTGLLGLLAEAASREMVDLPSAIDRLTRRAFGILRVC